MLRLLCIIFLTTTQLYGYYNSTIRQPRAYKTNYYAPRVQNTNSTFGPSPYFKTSVGYVHSTTNLNIGVNSSSGQQLSTEEARDFQGLRIMGALGFENFNFFRGELFVANNNLYTPDSSGNLNMNDAGAAFFYIAQSPNVNFLFGGFVSYSNGFVSLREGFAKLNGVGYGPKVEIELVLSKTTHFFIGYTRSFKNVSASNVTSRDGQTGGSTQIKVSKLTDNEFTTGLYIFL
jgi:hypothetical protein